MTPFAAPAAPVFPTHPSTAHAVTSAKQSPMIPLRILIVSLCIIASPLCAQPEALPPETSTDAVLPPESSPPPHVAPGDLVPAPAPAEETTPKLTTPLNVRDALAVPAPELPALEEVKRELPKEQVVLEMPGGAAQRSTVSRDSETISVDFPDEEVRTILRNVADLYELNVVIPDTLVGSASIRLRNVTWRQVFKHVLTPVGYSYVEEDNIISIKSLQELNTEPVDTRVFVINFATAGDLSPVIAPLIDPQAGGRVQVDARRNALIISERPSRMGQIIDIIQRLDRPTEQVMIESKFVEVTNRDLFDLGVNWSSLRGYQASAEWGREIEDEQTDTNESSVTRTNTRSITVPATMPSDTTTRREVASVIDQLIRTDTAVFDLDAFNVLISALESNDKIELISNPTVVTLSNTPAVIHIGDQYPIPNYRYNEEQGVFIVDGFNYKDIGISLEVLPQINSGGFINLRIHPEISSETGSVTFGGAAGATIPVITRRTTESTVTIKDGYTLAIGGLMERTNSTTDTKVPILGDIPVVGHLFRHDSDSTDQRNLIIFITAKILNPDGSTYRDVFSQRRLFEMGIKSRDLPGYTPTEDEEALFNDLQRARDEIEQLRAENRLQAQLRDLEKRKAKDEKNAAKNEGGSFKSRAR